MILNNAPGQEDGGKTIKIKMQSCKVFMFLECFGFFGAWIVCFLPPGFVDMCQSCFMRSAVGCQSYGVMKHGAIPLL